MLNKSFSLTNLICRQLVLCLCLAGVTGLSGSVVSLCAAYAEEPQMYREYYEEGIVRLEVPVQGEQWHGTYKEFDEAGKLLCERDYRLGKLNGVSREFYEDGPVSSEWHYNDNIPFGIAREFGQDGRIIRQWNYEQQAEGIVVMEDFYPNKRVFSKSVYEHNTLKHVIRYDDTGKIIME